MTPSELQDMFHQLQKSQAEADKQQKYLQELQAKISFEKHIVETQKLENLSNLEKRSSELDEREKQVSLQETQTQKSINERLRAIQLEEHKIQEDRVLLVSRHRELQDAIRETTDEKSRLLDQKKQIHEMVERTKTLWASFI